MYYFYLVCEKPLLDTGLDQITPPFPLICESRLVFDLVSDLEASAMLP